MKKRYLFFWRLFCVFVLLLGTAFMFANGQDNPVEDGNEETEGRANDDI